MRLVVFRIRLFSLLILLVSLLVGGLSASAYAAELKVKVVDPRSAAVPGAQVTLLRVSDSNVLASQTTSAEGIATLRTDAGGPYQIRVLAPGFAAETVDAGSGEVTVNLRLATASETVVVSATRTPISAEESGASISTLESSELDVMQPVAESDALRFLPGAVVNASGQRGALSGLFVRGGDSVYNKVIVDGVPTTEPGGTFDFGTVPLAGVDRLEFLRGAQSTLYGSDAMTSVVQLFSSTGTTAVPELRFGADGGNFNTAHGFATLAGARGIWDYDLFADQFNTQGLGVNNDYSNSLQGANTGIRINDAAVFRVRVRHANSRTGVPGEWNFNGDSLLPPDIDARARQNNLLASVALTVTVPSHWQHSLSGYEYNHKRLNEDSVPDRGCDVVNFIFTDCFFLEQDHMNRAGFNYQGDYTPRSWAQTTVGYEFEDENGNFDSQFATTDNNGNPIIGLSLTHGLRLNHALFVQQRITRGRVSVVGGLRYVHNASFGDRAVPRVSATFLAFRGGGDWLSGTRLRFSYAGGIKEPTFEESFGITGTFPTNPNPGLKAEENHAFEAGLEQSLRGGKYSFSAIYFNNQFHNQIEFESIPPTFVGEYVNVNRSMAHGAEVEFRGQIMKHLQLDSAYNYTSTQILEAPLCTPANFCDPLLAAGSPLLRRPKHSGSMLLSYLGARWGANLGGSFVGRRPDSDFLGLGIDHAAGYVRADVGGWYAVSHRVTAYLNVENALDRRYNEVLGYPALPVNFRGGLRFRIGGE
ncbi:MAG TPA: TonB-dependent receptor [Candidatus Sulfotelmatobacter sp.]|nr:TonB-dependent receptor [Candidatus Sulfotelmatobacter sp.]